MLTTTNSLTARPLISIITVVYNDVKHLEETMLSVLNQTYQPVEYIVIDGGSTDGAAAIIKKYASRLAYWVSEKDNGIADAMNKGITKATGEWIDFINSGDYFVSTTIFEEIFSKPHHGDLLYGGFIGNFNGQSVKCLPHPVEMITEKAWQGMQLCHSTLFPRLKLMQQHNFDTNCKVAPDGEFVAWCVANRYTFERVDYIIFRVGTLGNSSKHWLKGRLENWRIARTYFNSIRTNLFHLRQLLGDILFRTFKRVTSVIGLYQLARWIYRSQLQYVFPLLPPDTVPLEEKKNS